MQSNTTFMKQLSQIMSCDMDDVSPEVLESMEVAASIYDEEW